MRSLRARLLLVSAVVLAGFLGLTGLALDQAFRASAESALRDEVRAEPGEAGHRPGLGRHVHADVGA